MKSRLISLVSGIVLVTVIAVFIVGVGNLVRRSTEAWAQEFPVEGLVPSERGSMTFERIPIERVKKLSRMGFPQAMRRMQARVRHLIIYREHHHFFTTDGRVIVMTPGSDGRSPQWVETIRWDGAPHDFREYRNDSLPSP